MKTFTVGYNGRIMTRGDSQTHLVSYNDSMTGRTIYVEEGTLIVWEEEGFRGKTLYKNKKLSKKITPIYRITSDTWTEKCQSNSDFHNFMRLENGTIIAATLGGSEWMER